MSRRFPLAVALAHLSLAQLARGQPPSASPDPEHSATFDALPGVHRVSVPVTAPGVAAAAALGYGFTEPQADESSAHHGLFGSLAFGGSPWSFLGAAMRLDLRHDRHGADELGADEGTLLSTSGIVRLVAPLGSGLHVGAEGRVALPGAALTRNGHTPGFWLQALASYEGIRNWTIALTSGYRPGTTGAILEEAARMRRGDRVVLGLSEFDAVTIGLGVVTRALRPEVFGEATWDVLVGSGAPPLRRAPFRTAVGVRHPLTPWLKLQAVAELSPLARPPSAPGDPLVPVEPRFTALLGAVGSFGAPSPAPKLELGRPVPVVTLPPPTEGTREAARELPRPEMEPAVPRTAVLRIVVVDTNGHPISDAVVTTTSSPAQGGPPETLSLPLKELNVYELEELPAGEVELVVRAELLKEHSQTLVLAADQLTEETIILLPAAAIGSQLRGTVRSYTGSGVSALITIEPGGTVIRCDDAGEFEIALEPGTYDVQIDAEGYRSQRRKLRVRTDGVTVLNADLEKTAF